MSSHAGRATDKEMSRWAVVEGAHGRRPLTFWNRRNIKMMGRIVRAPKAFTPWVGEVRDRVRVVIIEIERNKVVVDQKVVEKGMVVKYK